MQNREALIQKALSKWGGKRQLIVLMEECGELVQAASKILRETPEGITDIEASTNFIEELIDVELMVDQFRAMIPPVVLKDMESRKLTKLSQTLESIQGTN
jgi:hypothetical protein